VNAFGSGVGKTISIYYITTVCKDTRFKKGKIKTHLQVEVFIFNITAEYVKNLRKQKATFLFEKTLSLSAI